MQHVRFIAAIVISGFITVAGAAWAAPVVGVTPATIDRLENSSIEVTVSGLTGGELWLRGIELPSVKIEDKRSFNCLIPLGDQSPHQAMRKLTYVVSAGDRQRPSTDLPAR